ncbi:hypothetical protein ACIRL2_40980 [Embleya sp. NPDC127516]|uniref:hypothetical protein n=1 Tax=Embleya sp. NPDC127516 TaxID=3363990 RepID=UPI0038007BA6
MPWTAAGITSAARHDEHPPARYGSRLPGQKPAGPSADCAKACSASATAVSAIAHLAPAEQVDAVRAFVTGGDVVFAGAAGLMVLALLCALRMPDPRPAVEDASPAPANSGRVEPARVG